MSKSLNLLIIDKSGTDNEEEEEEDEQDNVSLYICEREKESN